MTKITEHLVKEQIESIPLLPLRGIVAFPRVQINIDIVRPFSLAAFTAAATTGDMKILLVAQKDIAIDEPKAEDLYEIGVLAVIKHVVKNTQGNLSVLFEGVCRARVDSTDFDGPFITANASLIEEIPFEPIELKTKSLLTEAKRLIKDEIAPVHPSYNEEAALAADSINDFGYFSDFTASSVLIDYANKQEVLETVNPRLRLESLLVYLNEELVLLECERDIQKQVRDKIDRSHKDYFLREQVKAIQAELGEDEDDEIFEYETKINEKKLPDEVRAKLMKELAKLAKTPFGAAEGAVIRSYLDTCLDFPFMEKTRDETSVAKIKERLDSDHEGLDKIKDRILEFVAVKQFNPDIKNQILCLIGPPGVGKTSIAASIAAALGRKYARLSLGGVHDEAEIRGHRRTYVGAMPGRIITAISQSGTVNPVVVLDEIDKLANDSRNDPTAALLEVLDPEQNKFFRDNFIELPIDLSDCIFIATANSYDRIPSPLLDRMEVMELSGYTDTEKLSIAKNHLIPKQMKRHGMTKKLLKISDSALMSLIREYTKEAGVRNLEREIASVIRKCARRLAEDDSLTSISVSKKNLEDILGKTRIIPERLESENPVGEVNGLAYTERGGELLRVEVSVMDGSGKIELTGSLGEVMKESAKIAHSVIRTICKDYGIDPCFYKDKDLHIHFPEGAIPKDGPSAGITMATAMLSALSARAVKRDIAMTGEISLRGKVLPIGGLKEKTLAAYRCGISTVIIPKDNARDLEDIDKTAREALNFIPCETITEVISHALA